MAKSGSLRFIRIFDFDLIPKTLVDQIPELPYKPEKIYKFAKTIGTNPYTMLYCLADKEHRIKGFFWGTLNPLDESLFIHLYSVEKGCQKGENFLRRIVDFIDELTGNVDLKVYFSTLKPKAFERVGATRSKFTLMEYESKKQSKEEQ